MFCFICSDEFIQIISSYNKCGLFSSVFKNIIPNNTTPTFKRWVFADGLRTSHGIPLTITKLNDFYSQGILTFLFVTVFK